MHSSNPHSAWRWNQELSVQGRLQIQTKHECEASLDYLTSCFKKNKNKNKNKKNINLSTHETEAALGRQRQMDLCEASLV